MNLDPDSVTFASNYELMEQVKKLVPEDPDALVCINGTPLESIWPSDIVHNGEECVSLAFGPSTRQTAWGYMPEVIYLLKKKYWHLFLKKSEKTEPKKKKHGSLFPPGWKPKPGFTDPRLEE